MIRRMPSSSVPTSGPVDLEVVEVLGVDRRDHAGRPRPGPGGRRTDEAASAASFQPSKAAMRTGDLSCGHVLDLDHPPSLVRPYGAGAQVRAGRTAAAAGT